MPLHTSTNVLAYLRSWDQSERFVVAFNWSPTNQSILKLSHEMLPEEATVAVSTNKEKMAPEQSITLEQFELAPQQAVMLKFPYVA